MADQDGLLRVRIAPALLAAVDAGAEQAGLSRSGYVKAALTAATDGRLWQTFGHGQPPATTVPGTATFTVTSDPAGLIPAGASNEAVRPRRDTKRGQPRVPSAAAPTVRDPGRVVHAAASVVAPTPDRPSPKREGNDPKAGCTHPPAVVRPRGGVRSCGNCGTVLPGK